MIKTMGLYCKAYYLRDLRAFDGWTESLMPSNGDDASRDAMARPLQDDDIVFVHDDHTVTAGVFAGMTVLNDGTTDGWPAFCKDVLGFVVPPDVIEAGALVSQDLAEMSN